MASDVFTFSLPLKNLKLTIPKDIVILSLLFIGSTLLLTVYLYLFQPLKLTLLYRNWDGPNYVVIAKSFYDTGIIEQVNNLGVSTKSFSGFFPLFPFFIRVFSFLGYFQAMIVVNHLFALVFIIAFYYLVKEIFPKISALWVTIPLIFFPPRWFVVSHVGSSETVFLAFVTLSLLLLVKKRFILAALCAALAQLARAQAILFVAGLGLYYLVTVFVTKEKKMGEAFAEFLPFIMVPLSLGAVFYIFQIQYGDFYAFFHTLNNIEHLQFLPFSVFKRYTLISPEDVWQETYVYTYLLYLGAIVLLVKDKLYLFASIACAYFIPLIFLVHADVSRYALALLPFLFLGYRNVVKHPAFLWTVGLIAPAIYVYAVNFMGVNLAP